MLNYNKVYFENSKKILLPIGIQNLIFFGLGMVDTLMIGQLGTVEIAGVSLANQYFFILTLIFFGLTGGASIFTSQYFGANKFDEIKNIYGVTLKLAGLIGLLFTLIGSIFPDFVISLFSRDFKVIDSGSKYLSLVSLSYIFSGFSLITTGVLRSMGDIKRPMIISAISLLINTLLNYIFIFGLAGFPSLGVKGAALATVISRIFEFFILLTILKREKSPLTSLKLTDFILPKEIKNRFYKTLTPVVINETMWSTGTAIYSAIYANISTESVAAYQIQQTITNLFLIFVFGLGNASSILIGNELGKNDNRSAYDYGKYFIKFSVVIGFLTGLLILALAPPIAGLFNVSNNVYKSSIYLIYISTFFLIFKSINISIVVGIFRGGGDTKVAMFMDIVGVWGIGIPLALFSSFILKKPVEVVYTLVCIEEILKSMYGIYRFKSKKWINNLI